MQNTLGVVWYSVGSSVATEKGAFVNTALDSDGASGLKSMVTSLFALVGRGVLVRDGGLMAL